MKEVNPNKRTGFFSRLLCKIGIHDRFVMRLPSFQEEAFVEYCRNYRYAKRVQRKAND